MTEMITNISDPHFFIEVKSKKNLSKTCNANFFLSVYYPTLF